MLSSVSTDLLTAPAEKPSEEVCESDHFELASLEFGITFLDELCYKNFCEEEEEEWSMKRQSRDAGKEHHLNFVILTVKVGQSV